MPNVKSLGGENHGRCQETVKNIIVQLASPGLEFSGKCVMTLFVVMGCVVII